MLALHTTTFTTHNKLTSRQHWHNRILVSRIRKEFTKIFTCQCCLDLNSLRCWSTFKIQTLIEYFAWKQIFKYTQNENDTRIWLQRTCSDLTQPWQPFWPFFTKKGIFTIWSKYVDSNMSLKCVFHKMNVLR